MAPYTKEQQIAIAASRADLVDKMGISFSLVKAGDEEIARKPSIGLGLHTALADENCDGPRGPLCPG